ncbi:cell division transport system permease protein [Tistlia consotensis]|uniref:Cell division transport system permease protein n=1 Tax=Tistlia consotensis USBA 355 TaxID=560819 RepID=A0A1Y6B4K7_9PROT|nr:FtsX-like permease family protein [Tistlia consotensis]SME91667.1 cell division transport system permease protein [Tistlia consotensis USBA 355]SNR27511.1 cell division transport system permease protein [Tistlia consotensis]
MAPRGEKTPPAGRPAARPPGSRRRRRRDLPLANDASARYLPWLIAFLVFLAGLALVGGLGANRLAARWDSGLAGKLTVQVMPGQNAEETKTRVGLVLDLLTASKGVASVEVLDRKQLGALLEPWLGASAYEESLPLPMLIDVTLDPGVEGVPPGLAERLEKEIPAAHLDDHQRYLGALISFARSLQLIALAVVVLVGAATILTLIFVTRTGLSVHRQTIELLHLMGARDRYVAGQFQGNAARLALRGGLVGLVAAGLVLYALERVVQSGGAGLLPSFSPTPVDWAALLVLPPLAVAVAALTARWTVLRTLTRLP